MCAARSLGETFCFSLVLPLSAVLSTWTSSLKIPLNSSGGQRVRRGKESNFRKRILASGLGKWWRNYWFIPEGKAAPQAVTEMPGQQLPAQKGLSITPENRAWHPYRMSVSSWPIPPPQSALGSALQREWRNEGVHQKVPEQGQEFHAQVARVYTVAANKAQSKWYQTPGTLGLKWERTA